MRTSSTTHDLDQLAAGSAGIVTRTVLVASGWSTSAIDRALASRELHSITPGVYRLRGAPWTRAASRHAVLAAAGRGAALARTSAAELHGLMEPRPGPHHLLVPHEQRRPVSVPPTLAQISRTRTLAERDVEVREGLQVTTIARTLLDLGRATDHAVLAELLAAALQRDRSHLTQVRDVLDRNPAARGRRRLRDALDLLEEDGARVRSEVEVAALDALLRAGLPRPMLAFTVHGPDGQPIAEVDLAYPRWKLAIEIDGFRWHSTPARKVADEARQNQLVLAGWTVLRFSAAIVRKRPEVLTQAVAAVLPLL